VSARHAALVATFAAGAVVGWGACFLDGALAGKHPALQIKITKGDVEAMRRQLREDIARAAEEYGDDPRTWLGEDERRHPA
jgi:hypothetical protein